MVMDFSLLYLVKELIDSFDHSYLLWNEENDDFKSFIRNYSARVIELPFSPTAETISIMLFALIDRILSNMEFKNGEGNVQLSAVRIHETVTGYAEATRADWGMLPFDIRDIRFSEGIRNVWQNDILSRIG
jgi:6-pyruvoyltetrahydropterin/6-carboxytetrahydropterin synthase